MKIWITRHGQTDYNKKHLMQGRTDAPLNETGIRQAEDARERIGNVRFDAVYTSPLKRAKLTGAIIGGVDPAETITDERLTEVDFGRYELKPYGSMGPHMTLYWMFPELIPVPETVESPASMKRRAVSFLNDLEGRPLENVLVACHGGIMRALCGYLENKRLGLLWRPKPRNCEIRIYEAEGGRHRRIKTLLP